MKKLVLVFGIFCLLVTEGRAQVNKEPLCFSYTPCLLQRISPALGFSFYFHPTFIRSTLISGMQSPLFINETAPVFSTFRAMDFHFDKNAVFCRMENECTKRYGFMLSIHAGGYRER
jgi:hypothetical protein